MAKYISKRTGFPYVLVGEDHLMDDYGECFRVNILEDGEIAENPRTHERYVLEGGLYDDY